MTDPVLVYTLFGFKLDTVEEVDLPETGLSKYPRLAGIWPDRTDECLIVLHNSITPYYEMPAELQMSALSRPISQEDKEELVRCASDLGVVNPKITWWVLSTSS